MVLHAKPARGRETGFYLRSADSGSQGYSRKSLCGFGLWFAEERVGGEKMN